MFGTVRHDTFAALNRAAGVPLAGDEIEGFYTRGEPVGVLRVLRALDAHLCAAPTTCIGSRSNTPRRRQPQRSYSEFFWNPTGRYESGIGYRKAQDAIVRAIHDAESNSASPAA